MFSEPAIHRCSQRNDPATRSGLETERLQLEGSYPRVPKRIFVAVDVHIRRAMLVCESEFFAVLFCEDRLFFGVLQEVRALLSIGRLVLSL